MGELTGYPASIAAQLFTEGKIQGVGIIPPESLPEGTAKLFFEELKKRNIELIFDEKEPLEWFKNPVPYVLGFFSNYGFIILKLIGLCSIFVIIYQLLAILF
ncbi:MAG: hypothetical protein EAX86_03710 [Candidatus Heimdallarchaeota archaeon]|nr:hypothetical protein [Candidatus Heimdallarchaeota archaeon]